MISSKNIMRRWLAQATPEQRKALAKAAKTSLPHLRHIATGRRGVMADLAQRLAAASRTLGSKALILDPRQLCQACSTCPLAKKT
jgi:hypothetical protein